MAGATAEPPNDAAASPATPQQATATGQEAGGTAAPTVPLEECFIRFRLSAIDYVQAHDRSKYDNRCSPFAKEELRAVPVIRIWGATDRGQRVTAHVHGAFPYVYVDYKGKLDPESVNNYIRRFGSALNRAMELSLPSKHKKGQSPQYVAFIVLCKGTHFYGYSVGYKPFLKVYMVNPRHKNRLSELLRSGAVLQTQFDVYEAHIPFLLQFMLDANLFGCGWVETGECAFREELPDHQPTPSDEYNPPSCSGPYAFRTYTTRTIPPSRMHPSPDAGGPEKVSYCALELDLPTSAILNRRRLTPRNLHHDFIELLHPERVERGKNVRSVRELWEDEQRRRAAKGESGPFDIVDNVPRAFDRRSPTDPIWRREPEFRRKVAARVDEDLRVFRDKVGPTGRSAPEFDSYVEDKEKLVEKSSSWWMERIRTTFEQVDAVYIERFLEDEEKNYPFGAWAVRGFGLNVTEAQEAAWLHAGRTEVDMNRLQASQAAAKLAARAARRRRQDPRIADEDDDGEMEADSDPDADGSDLDDGRPPPATQAEALARSRRTMDRAEQRGREDSVQEGEWEKDPDDDEDEEDYWGISAGTDGAPADGSLEGRSLYSVSPSVSPTKRPVVSPEQSRSRATSAAAASTDESDSGSPAKKRKVDDAAPSLARLASNDGPFGRQAASFLPAGPRGPSLLKETAPRQPARSPPVSRSASRNGSSPSVSPSKRTKHNPFASPTKGVIVRIAKSASNASSPQTASPVAEEPAQALFTFQAPPPASDESSRKAAVASQSVEDGSPISPERMGSTMTPSQAVAELADLPDDAFDEEYQPTPTIKEEVPSQIPLELQSSPGLLRLIANGNNGPARADVPETSETEEDIKPQIEVDLPTKKHVAFADPQASSSSSVPPSKTSTPACSTAASERRHPGLADCASQQTSEADSTTAAPAPLLPRSDYPQARRTFTYSTPPPTSPQLMQTIESYGQPAFRYKDPHYSKPADIPRKSREYGGRSFRLYGTTVKSLAPFMHYEDGRLIASEEDGRRKRSMRKVKTWEAADRPPTLAQAREWLEVNGAASAQAKKARFNPIKSQIEGPTQKSEKFTATKGAATQREKQHMAVLSMELHVNTRDDLLPDPKEDAVEAIFYCLQSDNEDLDANGRSPNTHVGVIAVGTDDSYRVLGITDYAVEFVEDELMLVRTFLDKLRDDWDPECVAGYEVHHASWGYLLERAEARFNWNLVPELGRVKYDDTGRFGNAQTDRWGFNQSSTLSFTGRHVLPIWRILKADNKFQQNSFEHIAFHVLRERTSHWSFRVLTEWYTSDDPAKIAKVFQYWRNRVEMNVEMIDAAEVVDQCWRVALAITPCPPAEPPPPSPSSESARVFGVDFNSVRTRGSQFKVESVMFKISKPESFLLLSPNRVQVGKQNAAECQPLIMEPKSAFYKGPLLVMDFQSLYPSVMIAYNYCYSTCLGRVHDFKGSSKFGTSEINLPAGLLHLMKDDITISPNGIMFVKPRIRNSLLAKMLSELLDTRVMVKSSMKDVEGDKALTKLLNARQLALKFLANVTYGYTSATFSGRMPAVEIADAIVQTGRETLERALETIHSVKGWGAEVVYGDTDSLFIYLPGKTKDEAFRIGNEIADVVTSQNPRPIKLKFEKVRLKRARLDDAKLKQAIFQVYLPCVLLAKKRYVGFKYEYKAQKEPDFDAKGIETEYCQRQWKKLQAGDVSPQDFVIAKKVKLGSYAEGRLPPPGAAVAARAMLRDPRAEPEYGERVPYVMFQAEPGQKQVHRAIAPTEFLADPRLRLDATHYIERMMIPPLERIFNLMGADVTSWYREMAKSKRIHRIAGGMNGRGAMLEQHFKSNRCVACDGPHGEGGLCPDCRAHPTEAIYWLSSRKQVLLQRQRALHQICVSCSSNPLLETIACDSIDCPNLYSRVRNSNELAKLTDASALIF
ncbi:DNA polymerase zeta subunit [Rhodotorula toruloides]|uniref:DNA polymerase n=1 Tax=Rhodotorula toruloides TaxID=5286 RepID=A0A511K727_RHOTO|nr:DNA polymerase zeta subunit [Rhodotorula toruloides]